VNNFEQINIGDSCYPELLKQIVEPPESFFLWGNKEILNQPALAIVGTRRCSAYGQEAAFKLASGLAQAGLIIVSGLARGIDEAAHKGALSVGGKTLGIVGSGLDRQSFYPQENFQLAQKIVENQGTVISEYPEGTPALPHHFPRRNRIISGLSLGVVVAEAKLKSGALITAEFALQQNREVFAIPGPIYHLNSQGPNLLIKNGAKLVSAVEDILEEFPEFKAQISSTPAQIQAMSELEKLILEALAEEPQTAEELAKKLNQPIPAVLTTLSLLELKGGITNNKSLYQIK